MDKENKILKVTLDEINGKIRIGIHDNGIGVDKEKIDYIFDRFYRADAARTTAKGGSGLGLAIAKQIIKEHDGEIWAESEKNQGLSVYIELEKTGDELIEKKILIIEDELSIAELERDYLEINGFEVMIETAGDSGLIRAQKEVFDLIILDLMLPNIDGFEICKRLRNTLNIPILMVSARKEDIDKIRGLGLGADDYVTKPFSPSELVARVKAHLSRFERLVGGQEKRKDVLNVRNITIDKSNRKVLIDSKEIFFTTKEYEVLLYMIENPNHVFTREELFDKIWGMEACGEIATVTVHVKKIREKIEVDTSKPQYIETVWGVGYRFKV